MRMCVNGNAARRQQGGDEVRRRRRGGGEGGGEVAAREANKRVRKKRGGSVGYVPPGVTTHEIQKRREQRHNVLWRRHNYSFCPPGVPRGSEAVRRGCVPSLRSQPSLSGLKKVCVRSFPSSSGILNGSFLMLSYKFCRKWRHGLALWGLHKTLDGQIKRPLEHGGSEFIPSLFRVYCPGEELKSLLIYSAIASKHTNNAVAFQALMKNYQTFPVLLSKLGGPMIT